MKDVLSAVGVVATVLLLLRALLNEGFGVTGTLWLGVIGSVAFSIWLAARRDWTHWRRLAAAFFLAGMVGGAAILCAVPQVPPPA